MSKYDPVWNYIKKDGRNSIKLTFEDIKDILGFEIDHSFLKYKKELKEFGYEVDKISLKEKTIIFNRISK
jgi:hypothetical protein